jgi:hypothetical protein
MVEGAVPDAGDSESHAAVSAADQMSEDPPELVMETDCGAGLAPPATAEKESAVGESAIVGGGVIVRVTLTVCGELVALAAATVIVSV